MNRARADCWGLISIAALVASVGMVMVPATQLVKIPLPSWPSALQGNWPLFSSLYMNQAWMSWRRLLAQYGALGRPLCPAKGRQQQRRQNADDRDRHEQFEQRETGVAAHPRNRFARPAQIWTPLDASLCRRTPGNRSAGRRARSLRKI